MKTVLKYFRGYKLHVVLSPLFKLCEAVFELVVPLVIADIIDHGILRNDVSYIRSKVLILILFALIGYGCSICAQYFAAYASAGIAADLRSDLFRKLQHLPIGISERIGSSNMTTAVTSDINQIQSGINLTLRLLLRSPFIVFGAIVMAMTVSIRMSSIFVVAVCFLSIIIAINMRRAISRFRTTRDHLDELVSITENGLAGVRVIRSYNHTADDGNRFRTASRMLMEKQISAAFTSSFLNPLTFLIINLGICLLIYRGGINVSAGNLSQGSVVALYNYFSQILAELIKLAGLIVTISRAVACAGRVDELMGLVTEGSETATRIIDTSCAHSVEFRDVSFDYEGNSEYVLKNISFLIRPGERIGIIGTTGCGKSTIAQLLAGLYPCREGQILIDGIDIKKIYRDDLHKSVSLCLQKTKMFTGSLKYNITLDREIGEDVLEYAVNASCSDDVVKSKRRGLNSLISSNGTGLSGGQKQRVGVARALAGMPGILIFDDSTSALDAGTEKRLLKSLFSLRNKPTQIFISQKIKTVMNADRIMIIDDGRIEAFDKHDALLRSSETYRKLYRLQCGGGSNE